MTTTTTTTTTTNTNKFNKPKPQYFKIPESTILQLKNELNENITKTVEERVDYINKIKEKDDFRYFHLPKNFEKRDDYQFLPIKMYEEAPLNRHFLSAEERRWLEINTIYQVIKKPWEVKLCEIGASIRLLKQFKFNKNLFINRAVIENADQERRDKVADEIHVTQKEDFVKDNCCECELKDDLCPHILKFNPSYIILTHVIYYLSPKLIYNILKRNIKIICVLHVFNPLINIGNFSNHLSNEYNWERKDDKIIFNVHSDKCYEHKEVLNYLYNNSNFTDGNAFIRVVHRIKHKDTHHIGCYIYPTVDKNNDVPTLYRINEKLYPNFESSELMNKIIINKGEGIMSAINSLKDGDNMLMNVRNEKGLPSEYYYAVRCIKSKLYFKTIKDTSNKGRLLFKSKEGSFWPSIINPDRWNQIWRVYTAQPETCDFIVTNVEFNSICSDFLLKLNDSKARLQFASFLRNAGRNASPKTFLFLFSKIIDDLYVMEMGLATLTNTEKYKIITALQNKTYKFSNKMPFNTLYDGSELENVFELTDPLRSKKNDPKLQDNRFVIEKQKKVFLPRVRYGIKKMRKGIAVVYDKLKIVEQFTVKNIKNVCKILKRGVSKSVSKIKNVSVKLRNRFRRNGVIRNNTIELQVVYKNNRMRSFAQRMYNKFSKSKKKYNKLNDEIELETSKENIINTTERALTQSKYINNEEEELQEDEYRNRIRNIAIKQIDEEEDYPEINNKTISNRVNDLNTLKKKSQLFNFFKELNEKKKRQLMMERTEEIKKEKEELKNIKENLPNKKKLFLSYLRAIVSNKNKEIFNRYKNMYNEEKFKKKEFLECINKLRNVREKEIKSLINLEKHKREKYRIVKNNKLNINKTKKYENKIEKFEYNQALEYNNKLKEKKRKEEERKNRFVFNKLEISKRSNSSKSTNRLIKQEKEKVKLNKKVINCKIIKKQEEKEEKKQEDNKKDEKESNNTLEENEDDSYETVNENEDDNSVEKIINQTDPEEVWQSKGFTKFEGDIKKDFYQSTWDIKKLNQYKDNQNINYNRNGSDCFWIALLSGFYNFKYSSNKIGNLLSKFCDDLSDEDYKYVMDIYERNDGVYYDECEKLIQIFGTHICLMVSTIYGYYYKVFNVNEDKPYAIFIYQDHYEAIENKDCEPILKYDDLTEKDPFKCFQGDLPPYCIDKENYDSFKFDNTYYENTKDTVTYSKELKQKGFSLELDYDEMIKCLPCKCKSDGNACFLCPVQGEQVDNWIYYQQCPRNLAFSARRVLNRIESQVDQVNYDIFEYYNTNWRHRFRESIMNNFEINVEDWFNHLPSKEKQLEVKEIFDSYRFTHDIPLSMRTDCFSAFGKIEFQKKGDKFRLICNPSPYHKYICGPATHSIEEIMSDVLGGMFAIGKSYKDKEDYMNKMEELGYDKFITLDLSGFDQSHTESMSKIWNSFIDDIIELKYNEIAKYCDPEEFREMHCKRDRKVAFNYVDFEQANKPTKHLWTMTLKDKLCSGSCFTSTKNTLTMVMHCLYVGFLSNMDIRPHAAGDDVLCHTRSCYSDDQINEAFYKVFQPKNKSHIRWGNGLILKYCCVTTNPHFVKPCSTEVYKCPIHGYKIIRPFYKVSESIFASHKFKTKYKKMHLPIELYKFIIKQGDRAWFNNIYVYERLYNLFLNKKEHQKIKDKNMKIEKYIKGKKKLYIDLKPENKKLYNTFKISYWQKLRSELLGESYVVNREHLAIECNMCQWGFDKMFTDLYGFSSYTVGDIFKNMQIMNYDYIKDLYICYNKIQKILEKPPSEEILQKIMYNHPYLMCEYKKKSTKLKRKSDVFSRNLLAVLPRFMVEDFDADDEDLLFCYNDL